MKFHTSKLLLSCVTICLLANCSTTSKNKIESSSNSAKGSPVYDNPLYVPASQIDPHAKRFLKSIDVGDLMMKAFNKEIAKQAANNPAVGEVLRRAFVNINPNDLENLAAKVYTRHLSKPVLEELGNFTEGPVGGRFFKSVFAYVAEGKEINNDEVMRQFDADELTALLKFTQSNAFSALQKKLPAINKELESEGENLGKSVLTAYLKNNP